MRAEVGRRGVLLRSSRLDLCRERFVIPLGAVELLRGRGLLIEQAARPLVRPGGDLPLCLQNPDLLVGLVHT